MTQDENVKKEEGLTELSGSNFEIADGEPDIKGWDVKNNKGQKIGEVDDLLFDVNSRTVKYIIVDLDDDLGFNSKKVLIPIALAELHSPENYTGNYSGQNKGTDVHEGDIETFDGEKVEATHEDSGNSSDDGDGDSSVVVPATHEILNNLPDYKKGNVTDAIEATILTIFNSYGTNPSTGGYQNDPARDADYDDSIKDEDYAEDIDSSVAPDDGPQQLNVIEENLQVGKRKVATGGTRLISRIVEKPVEKSIALKDEQVTVVRTPVNRAATSADFDGFKEEQIEMTEYSEVPIVNKEARVVEEIVVTKDVVEKEETIRETLRNTEVTAEEIKKKPARKKSK